MANNTSKLGTLEHWDSAYSQEIENFNSHGDIGEIWFGSKSVRKMIDWIKSNTPSNASILDIGSGNGHLLLELYKCGFKNSLGIDYSENAVCLAQAISKKMESTITFKTMDFLNDSLDQKFDLILDKGTFDAISLSAKESYHDIYSKQISKHLHQEGTFLITSCNFNQEELESMLSSHLKLTSIVKYSQFAFGGSVGSTIVTCAFKLKHEK